MKREPKPRVLARLLKGWRQSGLEAPEPDRRRPGRPLGSGMFEDREHLEAAVTSTAEALRDRGTYPSQAKVAQILHCHPDSLGRLVRAHGLDWRELVSRSPSTRD